MLDLPNPTDMTITRGWSRVRNYEGQERYMPDRMLQRMDRPWAISPDIEQLDTGIGLPLRHFVRDTIGTSGCPFVENEAVMKVAREDDNDDDDDGDYTVIDHEKNIDVVPKMQEGVGVTLVRRWRFPWDFRVSQDGLNEWNIIVSTIEVDGAEERTDRLETDKGKGKKTRE